MFSIFCFSCSQLGVAMLQPQRTKWSRLSSSFSHAFTRACFCWVNENGIALNYGCFELLILSRICNVLVIWWSVKDCIMSKCSPEKEEKAWFLGVILLRWYFLASYACCSLKSDKIKCLFLQIPTLFKH